jgi:hypothetical protein
MPRFEWTSGARYGKLAFDEAELAAIREACAAMAEREYARMDDAAREGLETFTAQAQKVRDYEVAGDIASMFKAGQEVLIEAEDIEPLRDSLRAYCEEATGERLEAARSALRKIEEACQEQSPPEN